MCKSRELPNSCWWGVAGIAVLTLFGLVYLVSTAENSGVSRSVSWHAFSVNRLAEELANGRPVLVAYCTDPIDDLVAIDATVNTPEAISLLNQKHIVTMKAVFSDRPQDYNSAVEQIIARRNGALSSPFIAVYHSSELESPLIVVNLPNANDVVTALRNIQ
jgi:hypothetical protein